MKILFITPGCFDKGGISRYSRYQISALREIYGKDSIRVISFLGPDKHSFEKPVEVAWHGTNPGIIDRIKLIYQIVLHVLTWRPNIVHTALVNYSGVSHFLAKLIGAKSVLNIYGLEVWSKMRKTADYGMRNSDYVISDCHSTADYAENHRMRSANSIEVIWDCADLKHFRPSPENWDSLRERLGLPDRNQHFITVTLGRISKNAAYKGYDRLIKVFSEVHKSFPNSRLILVGRGDLVEDLKYLVQSLSIESQVMFTGGVTDEDLPAILSYAHLFSMVTESGEDMGEGIPLTPIEAMACGTPIIVGNQDGSREAIIDAINGYCIDPNDLDLHQKIIESLIKNPIELEKKAKGALKIAEDHFSYQAFKKKHGDFYAKIENI